MRFFSLFYRRPLLTSVTLLFAGALGGIIGTVAALNRSLPPEEGLKEFRSSMATRILDRNGKEIAELFREKRIWLPRKRLPKMLVDALLSEGDETFLDTTGVRYGTLLSALFVDLRKGTMMQGGDTITGQLARRLLPAEERTTVRKLRETLLALKIEEAYAKDELLEIYANTVPLGSGARGFEAAARIYFDKTVGELTLAESALLAGLTRTPERYDLQKEPGLAVQRRDTILSRMAERGLIGAAEEQAARREPLRLAGRADGDGDEKAPLVVAMVRGYLLERYGADRVFRQGLTVTTTIDLARQQAAETALRQGLETIRQRIVRKRMYSDKVIPQGLLVALRPGDGEIVALVGQGDAENDPVARLRPRRTGGTILPFITLAALESGYSLVDRLDDTPALFTLPGEMEPWTPVNRNGRYMGSVTVREALTDALTVASTRLLEKVGVDHLAGALGRFGIALPLPRNLTLVNGEKAVPPLDLVGAYAGLANGGFVVRPGFIRRVAAADGTILEEREPVPIKGSEPAPTFVLTRLLEGVARDGVARAAAGLDRPVAAMSGESADSRDAWFVGYTPTLATGVWVGLDRDRSLGREETGALAAGTVWSDFMIRALDGAPTAEFVPPPGVVVKNVDRASGTLASEACGAAMAEVFVQGTEPVEYCHPAPPRQPKEVQ